MSETERWTERQRDTARMLMRAQTVKYGKGMLWGCAPKIDMAIYRDELNDARIDVASKI